MKTVAILGGRRRRLWGWSAAVGSVGGLIFLAIVNLSYPGFQLPYALLLTLFGAPVALLAGALVGLCSAGSAHLAMRVTSDDRRAFAGVGGAAVSSALAATVVLLLARITELTGSVVTVAVVALVAALGTYFCIGPRTVREEQVSDG